LPFHEARLVAVTGGPGAGKTAVLELAVRSLCEHVAILPEAATIVFGGGFPRHQTHPGLRAAQRAIYRVQREVEALVIEERQVAVALCDRGTVDGLAYWPDPPDTFWAAVGSTLETELGRYHAVIHLRTPAPAQGYHTDPIRNEPAARAAELDGRIAEAWRNHPHRFLVDAETDFTAKADRALELIRNEMPACCASHMSDPEG
jgi:predicted ATPase